MGISPSSHFPPISGLVLDAGDVGSNAEVAIETHVEPAEASHNVVRLPYLEVPVSMRGIVPSLSEAIEVPGSVADEPWIRPRRIERAEEVAGLIVDDTTTVEEVGTFAVQCSGEIAAHDGVVVPQLLAACRRLKQVGVVRAADLLEFDCIVWQGLA